MEEASRDAVLLDLNDFLSSPELDAVSRCVGGGLNLYCDATKTMSVSPKLDVVLEFCCRLCDEVHRFHLTSSSIDSLKVALVPILEHRDVIGYISGLFPHCDGTRFSRLIGVDFRSLGY